MPGYDMTGMWGWGLGMMLVMPILWILVIAAAVWVVVRLTRAEPTASGSSGDRAALRILEERLARGEIDVEEFRSRRAAIGEGR